MEKTFNEKITEIRQEMGSLKFRKDELISLGGKKLIKEEIAKLETYEEELKENIEIYLDSYKEFRELKLKESSGEKIDRIRLAELNLEIEKSKADIEKGTETFKNIKEDILAKDRIVRFNAIEDNLEKASTEFLAIEAMHKEKVDEYNRVLEKYKTFEKNKREGKGVNKQEFFELREELSTLAKEAMDLQKQVQNGKQNIEMQKQEIHKLPRYKEYIERASSIKLTQDFETRSKLTEIQKERLELKQKQENLKDFKNILDVEIKELKAPFKKYIENRVKALDLQAKTKENKTKEESIQQGVFTRTADLQRKKLEEALEGRSELIDLDFIDELLVKTSLRYKDDLTIDDVLTKAEKQYYRQNAILEIEEIYRKEFLERPEKTLSLRDPIKEVMSTMEKEDASIEQSQAGYNQQLEQQNYQAYNQDYISKDTYQEQEQNQEQEYVDEHEEEYDYDYHYEEDYEEQGLRAWFRKMKDKMKNGFSKVFNSQKLIEEEYENTQDYEQGIRAPKLDVEKYERIAAEEQTILDKQRREEEKITNRELSDDEKEEVLKGAAFRERLRLKTEAAKSYDEKISETVKYLEEKAREQEEKEIAKELEKQLKKQEDDRER